MGRLQFLQRSEVVLALVVTLGVIGSAAADWSQGQAPESRIPGIAGFGPFLIGALVCLGGAILATDARWSPRWRLVSLVGAVAATALADPTYATLLAIIPFLEITRRSPDPERILSIAAGGVVLAWLVITEDSGRQGSAFESILVLCIVMTVAVMFGNSLRRNDEARILEARLARVDERNRLALDIHDSLGHNLLASSIQLRTAQALIEQDVRGATNSIDLAANAVAEALAETRLIVDNTRAAGEPFSLERSLSGLVERISTPQLPVKLEMRGDHRPLDSVQQITLYRFAQETLANVVRHADASGATITSDVADGTVSVAVIDNGRGFDVGAAPEQTGLANLRDRLGRLGGTVSIQSNQGEGTTVTAELEVSQ